MFINVEHKLYGMATYRIQHQLHGQDNEFYESYTEVNAQSASQAEEIFRNDFINTVNYWDIEITEIIEKKYS